MSTNDLFTRLIDRESLRSTHPGLFSGAALTIDHSTAAQISDLVQAVEKVVAMPAYQTRVLSWSPANAQHMVAARGVFFGYDVHLGPSGPQLIEINTNAGGGLLNACLLAEHGRAGQGAELAERFVDMFRAEWRLARGDEPLTRIVIVDEDPRAQYLAPEFLAFQRLFEGYGIHAMIADPSDFSLAGEVLLCRGQPVDLVYNRLTDFDLSTAGCAVLQTAYSSNKAVITPHSRAHALFADKRNLICLSDAEWLEQIGVDGATRQTLLAGVPKTLAVDPVQAETFWRERKHWFFKPATGFGSRAVYRGDKLTKRVFEEILQGNYIAQRIAPPSELTVDVAGVAERMKVDVRAYVYNAEVQLLAARLYQGQTTNFRTPGGGFAPVFVGESR